MPFKLYVKPVIGSPPRVRGTAREALRRKKRRRITPARAGNREARATKWGYI